MTNNPETKNTIFFWKNSNGYWTWTNTLLEYPSYGEMLEAYNSTKNVKQIEENCSNGIVPSDIFSTVKDSYET